MNIKREMWDAAAEGLAPAARQALQLKGVQSLLAWVKARSPMQRERLAQVDPADVRTLADFAALVPLSTKDDLRAAMDRIGSALPHLCVAREDIVLSGPSAGTSGRQTYQAFNAQDLDRNVELAARLFWCSGLRPNDVLQLLVTPFTPAADIFRLGAQRVGVKWIIRDNHEPTQVPRYVEVARSLEPTFLQAGVATLRAMAQHAAATPAGGALPHRRAILMGAALGPEARAQFRQSLGIEVTTLSGQGSDFNLFSTECEAHDGEHWHGEDMTLVEVIDPTSGAPVGEGDVGEMVITDYYRRATPHVRWRTEDMVRVHPGICRCGRTSRRFTLLDRLANRVPVRGTAVYPFQVEIALSRSEDGRNLEFALMRKADEPQKLEVRLLRPSTLTDDATGTAVGQRLQHHLDAELKLPTQVSFHDDLPRVGYKTLRVIDEPRD
ncbi:phenylacetate--CoA ligase family protein [Piscinibacter sakaiensis]|uniref:phenylacetate--CoA ligase family protein n=1 Tax=Piscinibacter sakaiensis TaxID=1547922 RepID=UPI003AACE202